uniref:Uncharacterized protein n=1 Tax=Ciona intestinalis TaxID=7719 RepID=F6UH44_CIOIN
MNKLLLVALLLGMLMMVQDSEALQAGQRRRRRRRRRRHPEHENIEMDLTEDFNMNIENIDDLQDSQNPIEQ